jgi:hypothetical protein
MSGIILISSAIERYPLSIGAGFGDKKENEIEILKESAGFTANFFTKKYFDFVS